MPGKQKSILMTPDPYHTPGYCGFCPQYRFKIGETYGKITSQLLVDDNVANSGRPVLAELDPIVPYDAEADPGAENIRTRQQSYGDQKLVYDMVPGYSGFIPKSEHYFGKRYAKVCRSAISDFEHSYQCHDAKMEDLRTAACLQQMKTPRSYREGYPPTLPQHLTPMDRVRSEPLPYLSPFTKPVLKSPYYMPNSDPDKHFMSGYMGYVPRARELMGVGYPLITNKALIRFSDDISKCKEVSKQPVIIRRDAPSIKSNVHVYPMGSGMVPHYTGHIPGQKFRYGETFGNSTDRSRRSKINIIALA